MNKFLCFVNSCDGFGVLVVFLLPECVLLVSGGFFLCECLFVSFDVLDGLSDVVL